MSLGFSSFFLDFEVDFEGDFEGFSSFFLDFEDDFEDDFPPSSWTSRTTCSFEGDFEDELEDEDGGVTCVGFSASFTSRVLSTMLALELCWKALFRESLNGVRDSASEM